MRFISVHNRNENRPRAIGNAAFLSARKGKEKDARDRFPVPRQSRESCTRRQVEWRFARARTRTTKKILKKKREKEKRKGERERESEKKTEKETDGRTRDRFPVLHQPASSCAQEPRRFMLNAAVNTSQFTGILFFTELAPGIET